MNHDNMISFEGENAVFSRARMLAQAFSLESVTSEQLEKITRTHGVDVATAMLYQLVCSSPKYRDGIKQLNELRIDQQKQALPLDATFTIVPGAFYREFPHTGADGRLLRNVAEKLGYRTAMIPVPSTATLEDAARAICSWLKEQGDEQIILASVSKGGADVKLAMQSPDAKNSFKNVIAWINIGGMLDGSPMVDWLLRHRLRTAFFRALFWWRGYNFRVISDLKYRTPLLACRLLPPAHLLVINVVGFPLVEHLSNRLSRKFHRRISSLGPNDGGVMLADTCHWPGLLYPVWGADHYMRPSWELRSLAKALLEYVRIETTETREFALDPSCE